MLALQKVSRYGELADLELEWMDLLRRCPSATPFQHPGWVLPWWACFGSGELSVLTVREGSRLVCIAPLFLHEWENRMQFTILGTGNSDYLDVIAEPDYAGASLTTVYEYLADYSGQWDICNWQDLPASSPIVHTMPERCRREVIPGQECVSVRLPASPAELEGALPHGLRRNLRRYQEQLSRRGVITFETHRTDASGEMMHSLFDLHRKRWTLQGTGGFLQDACVQRFHEQAASHLAVEGHLRFYAMRLDGQVIAIIYAYVYGDTVYSYLGGFEPELSAFSPGSLILRYGMEEAIGEGLRHWDFLRGQEAYKFTWGGQAIPKYRILLSPCDS